MRVYPKHKCAYCGKVISANGLGKNAHYMKHVREGICTKVPQTLSDDGQGYYPPTEHWTGDYLDSLEKLKGITSE